MSEEVRESEMTHWLQCF